jgi:hypothetical protein
MRHPLTYKRSRRNGRLGDVRVMSMARGAKPVTLGQSPRKNANFALQAGQNRLCYKLDRDHNMATTTNRTDKVLVVDDDARIRDLLRRYLTQGGFEVMVAEDGYLAGEHKFCPTCDAERLEAKRRRLAA